MMCTPGAGSRHLAPEFPGARCFVAGDMKGGVSLKRAFKCSSRMLISGRQCTPVKSYGPNQSRQLCSMYFALQNRWFLKLRKGAIFEQNTPSKLCLSVEMSQRFAWYFWKFHETFELNRSYAKKRFHSAFSEMIKIYFVTIKINIYLHIKI